MSRIFVDGKQITTFYVSLFESMKSETNFEEMLEKSGLTIRFILKDPDAEVFVAPGRVLVNDEISEEAIAKVECTADDAHAVWTKKMPLTRAMATKKVKVKGPTIGIMKLVPALKPLFDVYPEHCKKNGIQT